MPTAAAPDPQLDATALAGLVRRGEVSPVELAEVAIERIERLDPVLNAVPIRFFDDARRRAGDASLPDGPFRGVPILFKDLGTCEAGWPQYAGNAFLRAGDHRRDADTPLAPRFRAAGFVALGKTSTPEFGAQPTTQPLAFGPTRNPWDVERSTSGSSGGSAAVVAAGMVPLAHASDGYGSIRDPASWCGLVGLKPSRGRLPLGGSTNKVGVEHVLTRSVRDTAAVLDLLAGPLPEDLYRAPAPAGSYAGEVGRPPGRLRVGMLTTAGATGLEVDRSCAAAAEDAGHLLEALGHQVSDDHPPGFITDDSVETLLFLRAVRTWAVNPVRTATGRPFTAEEVEPYTWAVTEPGRTASADEFIVATEAQQLWSYKVTRWWREHDLLVTPTTGLSPQLLADLQPPAEEPLAVARRFHSIRCFAAPVNVTGQPAVSLPLGQSPEGLPIGVQLIGAPGREDVLIRVASQLEAARPWAGRRPAVWA
ncbi:MAG: amidase [Actinobacteria bacterium]|nr:amidase [Actinomycetota bacterium]